MKFTEVWADALYANSILKITTGTLGLVTLILAFAIIRLGLRDPLVVESGCFSKVASLSKNTHSPEEIESFIKTSLERRFNSDAVDPLSFISAREFANRGKEQEEFKTKAITQKVLVNSLKINGTKITVDADRLLASGKVKSIIPFALQLDLTESDRTPSNPYGLLLVNVSAVKEAK